MGVVHGSMKCIQILLFIFNFIVFLTGIGIIVAGALALTKFAPFTEAVSGNFDALPYVFIVVGVLIFLMGFFGCFGAVKESPLMLRLYCVILSVFILIELVGAVVAVVKKDEFAKKITDWIKNAADKYSETPNLAKAIDKIQEELKCCVDSSKAKTNCTQSTTCDINAFLNKYSTMMVVCVFIFIILQILGVVAAGCMAHKIANYEAV